MNKDSIETMLKNIGMDMTNQNEWWRSFTFPETIDFDESKLINLTKSSLFHRCLQRGGVVYTTTNVLPNFDSLSFMSKFEARLVYDGKNKFYVMKDSAMSISDELEATLVTTDVDVYSAFIELI